MPKHHYLEGFDFTLPPEAFEPIESSPGGPGSRELATGKSLLPHRYLDSGRARRPREGGSAWRMASGHGDWSSPWQASPAERYSSWSYSYERQGSWAVRMASTEARGVASLEPSRPLGALGEPRLGWIFVQAKALPSDYDEKKGQHEASLIYRLARSLSIARKSMEKLALGEGAWALGAAPLSSNSLEGNKTSVKKPLGADIEILPQIFSEKLAPAPAPSSREAQEAPPRPSAAEPVARPAKPREKSAEQEKTPAPSAGPANALAAAKAIERRDLPALMRAVPRGAAWPASAPWMLAACAACHDWPAGIAFAKAQGHPLDGAGSDGLSPMDWAVARGSWSSAVALLMAGARPGDGLAPSLARLGAPLDVFIAAVERGADVNARDESGMSAIHWAAARGSREWAEALVKAKARLDSLDAEGRKAKDVAKAHKNYELSHYLQREGFRGRA